MCSRFSLSRISLYLKQCIFKVISFLFLELSLSRTKSSIALEFQIERVYVYSIFTLMQYKFKSLFRNKQNGRTFRRKVNFFFFFSMLKRQFENWLFSFTMAERCFRNVNFVDQDKILYRKGSPLYRS